MVVIKILIRTYLVSEENMKRKRKSKYEKGEKEEKLAECLQNVGKHDHEYPQSWNFLNKQQQHHPGQKYSEGSNFLLPYLKRNAEL